MSLDEDIIVQATVVEATSLVIDVVLPPAPVIPAVDVIVESVIVVDIEAQGVEVTSVEAIKYVVDVITAPSIVPSIDVLVSETLLMVDVGSVGGVQGPPGPEGPEGVQGVQGEQGIPGTPGTPGVQGDPGPVGPQGAAGAQGIQGSDGPPGVAGPEGPPGETGPQGAAGTGINIKGTVPTAADLPATGNTDGDAYVADDTDHIWVWEGAAWVDAGNIQGPAGPAGPQGVKGDAGIQGPQGPGGPQGAQGVQGPAGPQGVEGPVGAQGNIGPQGVQGIQGVQGDKGDTGDVGAEGPTGPQGADSTVPGPTGPTGPEGPQGPQGDIGPTGPQGSPDTAAQVLAKLLTVDGAGSGLDADFLDTFTSNDFVKKAGDSMVGHLGLPTGPAAANAVRKDYVDAADATLQTNINAKEPTIAPGSTAQYWRGDKSWQALDKAAVGLANVDNTSDANKPVSTATTTALNLKEDKANKGVSSGYASLDSGGKVPAAQLPSYVDDVLEFASTAGFPATGTTGVIYVALDTGKIYRWSGSGYVEISPSPGSTDSVPEGSTNLYFTTARAVAAAPVQSVSGRTGAVTLTKTDVGLDNVDNTSDVNKPVSTAQATADALRVLKTGDTMSGQLTISPAAANARLLVQAPAGAFNAQLLLNKDVGATGGNAIYGMTGGINRWLMWMGVGAESGANSGGDFYLQRYSDANALIDTPLFISRATGKGAFSVVPTIPAPGVGTDATNKTYVDAQVATKVSEAASDGVTYGRKNAAWTPVVSGGALISDTPPASPQNGQLWWESDTGNTYIWFVDAGGGAGQWVQTNVVGGPASGQVGEIAYFATQTAPPGFLEANGASYATSAYPDLFAKIGYTFGGAGSTFNVPDLRGEFVRGWDNGRGADAARPFGSAQDEAYLNHNHTASYGDHYHGVQSATAYSAGVPGFNVGAGTGGASAQNANRLSPVRYSDGVTGSLAVTVSASTSGGTETRPRNVALLACIRYLQTIEGLAADAAAAPTVTSGFRNKIINGDFDVAVRAITQTTSAMDSVDRWTNSHVGDTKNATRVALALGQTDIPGNPKYYFGTTWTAVVGASNYCLQMQTIEGVQTLSGKKATVTFWAIGNVARNIAVEIYQSFGSGGSPSAAVSVPCGLKAIGAGWTKVSFTVDIPSIAGKVLGSDGNDSLALLIWFDAGTTYAARSSGLGQASGAVSVAHVSIVEGDATAEADPFSPRHISQEKSLCERYCQRGGGVAVFNGMTTISGVYYARYELRQEMRGLPTLTLVNAGTNQFSATPGVPANIAATGFYEPRSATATAPVGHFGSTYLAEAEL